MNGDDSPCPHVTSLVERMKSMSDEERLDVLRYILKHYCHYCGSPLFNEDGTFFYCYCMRDD